MFHILVSGNTSILRGLGLHGLEMKHQIFKALVVVPSLALGIYYYGITGAAWAVLLNKIIVVLVAQYTFSYLIPIKISIIEFCIALKAPIIASVCSFTITYLLNIAGVNYIISGIVLCICYFIVIYLMMGKELKTVLAGLRKR